MRNQLNRRGFVLGAICGFASFIGAGLGVPALRYLLRAPEGVRKTEWIDAGDLADIEPERPAQLALTHRRTDGWKVLTERIGAWVVKDPEGGITAFSPRCTHLGCAYRWAAASHEFVCPCHASRFSIAGQVLSGPAPRPLDRYEVRVEGTRVWLKPPQAPEAAHS
ncbi:MAG: Rieske (2Fe-2S) protein [Bryobacteraceae bacterium]|jgi:menaquinol-cytochrome c reductase iron-sulfur subunit